MRESQLRWVTRVHIALQLLSKPNLKFSDKNKVIPDKHTTFYWWMEEYGIKLQLFICNQNQEWCDVSFHTSTWMNERMKVLSATNEEPSYQDRKTPSPK